MARLAILDENKEYARNVIEGDPDKFPDAIDVTGKKVSKNWTYDKDKEEFSPPPKPESGAKYSVEALADGEAKEVVVAPGDSVTVEIEILKDGETTTEFDDAVHRVPVLDVDGSKAEVLKLEIKDGKASATFKPPEEGLYTVDTSKVYPSFSIPVPNKPVVVAEE